MISGRIEKDADLVTLTKELLNGKLIFSCSDSESLSNIREFTAQ